jgi:hypothetical protein
MFVIDGHLYTSINVTEQRDGFLKKNQLYQTTRHSAPEDGNYHKQCAEYLIFTRSP